MRYRATLSTSTNPDADRADVVEIIYDADSLSYATARAEFFADRIAGYTSSYHVMAVTEVSEADAA